MPVHTPDPSPSVRADRRERVWQLRLAGNSYRQIGREIGVAHSVVQADIHAELAERANRTQLSVQEHVTVECARLDKLMLTAMAEWEAEKQPAMLNAIIRAIYTRARLLGLIQPSSVTVNANVTIVQQLQSLLPQLIALVPQDRLASAEGLISTIERALPAPEKEAV